MLRTRATEKVRQNLKCIARIAYKVYVGTTIFAFTLILFFADSRGFAAIRDWNETHVMVTIDRNNSSIKNVAENLNQQDFRQIRCLAVNSYFEARGEGEKGMAAVDNVVLNRVKNGVYPDGACQVVYETKKDNKGKPLKDQCQFSWFCDGKEHEITDEVIWNEAYNIAYNEYVYAAIMPDVTDGATYYHADYVNPDNGVWKDGFLNETAKIGRHIFFKPEHKKG
jgi:spore germination cell wall hydrolase CwlJ-like protein